MKKFWDKLVASGLWLQPCIMLGVLKYLEKTKPQMLAEKGSWLTLFVISFLPVVVMWNESSKNPNEDNAMMGKEKAMYPAVDKKLLHNNPTGIVLGKDKFSKKYVCKELEEDGHVFLIGGSGSGKSSCFVIPTLLVNPKTRIFAIDIKGELSFKTAKYGDEQVLIFNPSNRSQYGYDPFYALGKDSTTQQILETMQTITYSLIALPAGLKDPFWKVSARNLLIGLLVYYYKQGIHNLVGIIDEILGKSVRDSIEQIMNTTKPESVEYRYIVQFEAMEDETLGGIIAEMNNHLVIFSNDQDIRYAFQNNGCKLNPLKLEEGYSIYILIKEEKLSAYYDVLQLIINQTLSQLEKRAEEAEPIIFIVDELPRLLSTGKIDRLLDGARTLRSRKVCLYLITQSTEALMSAFSENEVADLISNCPYIIVLSAASSKTQKSVCAWCGKYRQKKQSWSGTGKDRKTTVSYEEKDIVEPSDLMTLKNTGDAIVITPYGYNRLKKVPWYEDKNLKPIAEKFIKYNKNIVEIQKEKGAK